MNDEKEMDIYGVGVKDKCHFVEVDGIIKVCSMAEGNYPFEVEVQKEI